MRSTPINQLLPLILLIPLHFLSTNVSALALPQQDQQQQQQDPADGSVLQVEFSITSASGTTSSHELKLYPDVEFVGSQLSGVVPFDTGTRIQKAWVTDGPSKWVSCEVATVPNEEGKNMFYWDGSEKAAATAEGEETKKVWEGDVEVKYVYCETVSSETTVV